MHKLIYSATAAVAAAGIGLGAAACGGSSAPSSGSSQPPAQNGGGSSSGQGAGSQQTWTTYCDVVGPGQFILYATNNTTQGLTPPGWPVALYSNGVQVGVEDNSGHGVLGGANSAAPYAGPGQTVHSNVWNEPVTFTQCQAL
jgi:hypothetical protein